MDEHELRSNMAIEAAGMAIWDATVVDGEAMRGTISWSARGAAMVGLPAHETMQPFPHFLALVHQDDRDMVLGAMQGAIDAGGGYLIGYRLVVANAVRSIRANARVLHNDRDQPDRTLGLLWDVTDVLERERLADERERMAEVTLECIGDGVITTDSHGATRYMNRAAEQLTGWSRQHAAGRDVGEVLPVVDEANGVPLEHAVYKCLLKREAVALSSHAMLVTRDGRRIAVEDTAAPIRRSDGEVLGAVVVFRDVTHQRALSSQLSWHASHDVLTGLLNRREFEQHIAHALHVSKQDDHAHALLYIDLDRFKLINDTAGHAAGDALLQILATLLQQKMRESDVLARLGGDELGVLLTYCQLDHARLIAEEIRQLIKEFRFVWDAHSFEIGASIGMVEISVDSKSVSDLLSAADEACYLAKDGGRNRIHVYSESDTVPARRHTEMMWVPRLTDALQQDGFALYAMPIAGLQGNRLAHEEILLRLKDGDGELIRPDRFIPAAERYHMMPMLDRWVIRAVCRYIAGHAGGAAAPGDDGDGGGNGADNGAGDLGADRVAGGANGSATGGASGGASGYADDGAAVDGAADYADDGATDFADDGAPDFAGEGATDFANDFASDFANGRANGPASGPAYKSAGAATGVPALFSVNLSGPSMNDDTLHQYITDQFAHNRIDPSRICFEITETAAIRNLPKAQDLMNRLKLIGCRFSLDDFGSGLSSFGYLKSLPVDFLKIDGSFIRGIASNPVHRAMVEAIHKVGRVIGIQTIAEFVEDAETLDVINNIGIDFAQGYAVGRERALAVPA